MKIPKQMHLTCNSANFASLALLLLLAPMLHAGTGAFNCGGGSMQVGSVLYQADREYTTANGSGAVGGSNHFNNLVADGMVIEGTAFPALYEDSRDGASEYRFDVPNGLYLLTLNFIELTENGPNLRVFSVSAEGQMLLQNFDIYATIEKNYAMVYQFAVQVNDGQLNVQFTSSIGVSTISGIAVQSITADTVPPPVPALLPGLGGYYRNILSWPDVTALDLAGYDVYGSASPSGPFTLLTSTPTPVSRYFDDAVTPGVPNYYIVRSVDVFGNRSAASNEVTATPLDSTQSTLPVYQLSITPANLAILQADPWTNTYVNADFTAGVAYPGIGVRFRGSSSRTADKKSWKLNFTKNQPFQNADKMNQKASPVDVSLIRECLGDVEFQTTAALTPNCAFSHLEVNGEYRGVFGQVQNMDSDFMTAHGLNPNGKMFEANSATLSNFRILDDLLWVAWDDDSKTQDGYATLSQFIETINNTPDADFDVTIASVLNVNSFLDFYSGVILMGDWDHTAHNYEVYLNPDSLIWEVMPIDFDHSFEKVSLPLNYGTEAVPNSTGTYNILTDRILQVPLFKQWWVNKLTELVGSDFTSTVLNPRIENFHSQIAYDATRDVFKRYRELNQAFNTSDTALENFVPARQAYVTAQLPGFSPGISPTIMLNEAMALNQTGITDESGQHVPWLELYNPTGQPFDLTGYYLSNSTLNRTMWPFPSATIVPAGGYLLVWLDAIPTEGPLHANFTISGLGQAISMFGPDAGGNALVDVIAFGPQKPDISYGRRFNGSSMWCPQAVSSPSGPNTGP